MLRIDRCPVRRPARHSAAGRLAPWLLALALTACQLSYTGGARPVRPDQLGQGWFRAATTQVVRQQKETDCGLAALAMVASAWGRRWSVADLNQHLQPSERGIKLGFENREKFEELPLDDDFEVLLAGLTQPHTAGYWHDTGHADIKQSMGMLEHRLHLQKNAARLLGFHLHDVTADGKDHQPIGAGRIDFNMISGFWRPEHLLTLELSPRVKVEDIVSSKERIEALMTARFGA